MVLKPDLVEKWELSRIRFLFGTAQRSIRELRAARLLTRYNPNQQRVPTGNPRGGQWTSESGGTGLPRTQWAQLRPRRVGGGSRLVGGRFVETTPGQEARLDVSAAEARALVREVQRHDPTWRPTPSIYEGIEGQILANRSDAQQARTRLGALGLNDRLFRPFDDVLLPGGRMIGSREQGAGLGVRTVSPGAFRDILEAVSPDAVEVPSPPQYEGQWYRRPDGSIFGVRRSEKNGITFDVIRSNSPSIRTGAKVHKK